jgi:hypothetical protein
LKPGVWYWKDVPWYTLCLRGWRYGTITISKFQFHWY